MYHLAVSPRWPRAVYSDTHRTKRSRRWVSAWRRWWGTAVAQPRAGIEPGGVRYDAVIRAPIFTIENPAL